MGTKIFAFPCKVTAEEEMSENKEEEHKIPSIFDF